MSIGSGLKYDQVHSSIKHAVKALHQFRFYLIIIKKDIKKMSGKYKLEDMFVFNFNDNLH
jgi:hypothetical protein